MNTTTRYLLSSAAALLLGSSALTAADFIWNSASNANYTSDAAWKGGTSPHSSTSSTTNSIGTPETFTNVGMNGGGSYVQNFNVILTQNWLWRAPNTVNGLLRITGTLTKAGDAALTFTNSAVDTQTFTLTINQLNVQAGVLNFGQTRERSREQLKTLTVTGGTTIAATLNVNSPSASFAEVTLSGGIFNILQASDESAANTTYVGGVTVKGLSGNSGTVQTRGGDTWTTSRAAQGTLTLSAESGSGSYTYGGTLADGSAGSTLAVVKDGDAFSQTLTGTNTYTGGTRVEAGVLATGVTGDFGTGDVRVLAATLTLGNATSIADTATLFFSDTSTINLSFTGTALIGALTNETSGTSAADGLYTAAQLNAFFGGNIFNGDGLLGVGAAIVPEPATVTALLGLIAATLFLACRRQRSAS
ncbi:autotransporter-associated beta strand repeat-containing protein [Geminisphaera colitermitum]|uniref:autotransporter-associated beta strand repeat-containing protein n=1 Tax=Geminisphaera colitermitum TaxID=1148786 RepID=UPI00019655E2|nr:autotransporter-associated beta strand repeat-containing protein [Geminisphaera colitermitum]